MPEQLQTSTLDAFRSLDEPSQRAALSRMSDEAKQTLLQQIKAAAPAAAPPAAPAVDPSRTATEVMQDQAANVLRGIPSIITGIPGALGSAAQAAYQTITGSGTSKARDIVKGMAEPFITTGKQAIELVKPGLVNAPSVDDPRTAAAAKAAGAMLAGAELPNVLAGIGGTGLTAALKARVGPLIPDAESLIVRANANRDAYAAASSVADSIDITKPLSVLKTANTLTRNARAAFQERLAQSIAGRALPPDFSKLPQPMPTNAAGVPMRTPQIASTPEIDALHQQSLAEQARNNFPSGDFKPPTQPSAPIPISPEIEALMRGRAFDNFPSGDIKPPSTPTPPIEMPNPPDMTIKAAPAALNAADVNKWMGTSPKEVLRGSNPGQQLIDEGLIKPTKIETKASVDSALGAAGKDMETHLSKATAEGKTIDAQTPVYDAAARAVKRIGSPRDSTFQAQINGIVDDIESRYPHLDKLSPKDTHALKVELGDAIKWSGPAYDTPVNQAMVEIYRDLNTAIKNDVPGIASVQSRWGNLYVASKNLAESLAEDVVGKGSGAPAPVPLVKKSR